MQAQSRCDSCGRDNPSQARFCVFCGAEIAAAAEEPPAASDPVTPEFPILTPARPAAAPADKAGVWQRIVLVLAGLLLMYVAVVLMLEGSVSLLAVGAVGVGLVYAAVRPPGGILRRLLVALGCLVISVPGAVIVLNIWSSQRWD